MEKIKLEILGLSPSSSQTGSFALVLGEEYGPRRLPIIIGMFEAQAIAIEIEKIEPNRPMTHDLFKSFARTFHYSVSEISITDIKEGVFFAKIHCSDGIKDTFVDARPSDAIAIGLRFNVPIYTYENVLSEAGISINETGKEDLLEDLEEEVKPQKTFGELLKENPVEVLNNMLKEALENEEYEKAAKIRDEIDRRN
ncbi:bifunctional nuclease domain-containing protein [Arcicella sp. LKC2W]|uniref:bifunctional nuclease domain-containing protein n=1 Tax=Arcicella sp. LKC2W TaxID=2984198 RepID=UPI002B1E917E|nr:bifunctional nuclease domain-containing protein [Arcicella sp. LKC2W]MEA5457489.1 bifunctional nuclease domain-containing protein [Arcicella sp. LKC2W]